MTRAQVIALAALKTARKAAAKPSVRGPRGLPGIPGRDGVDGRTVVLPPAVPPPPVGILDVEVEQNDLDVFFIITLTDGTRIERRVTLPKPKKGKDGKDGDSKPMMMRTYQVPAYITAAEFLPDNKLKLTFSDGTIVTTATGPTATTPALVTRDTAVDTTAVAADDVIRGTATLNVTLMAASARSRVLHVKNLGTGVITVTPDGGDTIDGTGSFQITSQYSSAMLVPNATGWTVV